MSAEPEVVLWVKLGYRTITVRRVPFTEMDGKAGMYLHHAEEIRVSAGLEPREEALTILHELTHAAWSARGVREGDDEERIVDGVSDALFEAFMRNEELLGLLLAEARRGRT